MTAKTIAFFNGYYLPHLGGVETYTEKLAIELKKMGYRIVVVTSKHDKDLETKQTLRGGVEIYRIPILDLFRQRYPLIKKNSEYRRVIENLMDENINYVICNTRFHLTSLIGIKIARKKKLPILLIEHGSTHFSINNKILDYYGSIYEHILTNYLKRHIRTYYGVSESCNQWLKHFGIESEGVFYNSVDKKEYVKFKNKHYINKDGKIIITYAGRIIKEKGIGELLEAYRQIMKRYPGTMLVVAGDGPIREELKRKYESKQIKFTGRLNHDDMMALYNDTDIFVHPSMYPEGLPSAILEAGLMKCAVIATDRGGTIEVINKPECGMIVSENTRAIKDGLCKLLDDPKRIVDMKNNLHKRITENFIWEITAKRVAKKIEEEL